MESTRFYIPLTIFSILIIVIAFVKTNSIESNTPPSISLEFDNVIHQKVLHPLSEDEYQLLKSFFPEALSKENLNQYLLLFVTGSDTCGQCLNEILDYITLANETAPIADNYNALLLYHGVDKAQSERFIRASNISSQVDELAFVPVSQLPTFDGGVVTGQYSSKSVLYVFDFEERTVFHAL